MSFEKAIVFACRQEEYALPLENIVSIEKLMSVNAIPHLPNYLTGFTEVRGELIPVVDFQTILYNQPTQSEHARMIIVNTDLVNYGLVVSDAREIRDFTPQEIKQVGLLNYAKTSYFTAIVSTENRMITCVDPHILVQSLEGIRDIIQYMNEQLKAQ